MEYLPFWLSGIALAAVPLLHMVLLRRSLAVSGRYSALVDRLRWGKPAEESSSMSQEELLAAMRALTAEQFGEEALEGEPGLPEGLPELPEAGACGAGECGISEPLAAAPAPMKMLEHVLFFGGITLGGALSWYLASGTAPVFALRSEIFQELFGGSPWLSPLVLFAGGMLVGAGTRMAGGCTTGHGLCGMSRLQVGSLVATVSFFGTGVVVSFLLGALL